VFWLPESIIFASGMTIKEAALDFIVNLKV
jgi:hypothetical protein